MRSSSPDRPVVAPWIAGPWTDLVVGCGAWSLPLLTLAYGLGEEGSRAWAGAFYALALVANYPHYMATVYRAYGAQDRTRHRAYTVFGTLGLIALGVVAHLVPTLVPWVFTAYVLWSPWHYTGQNYGLLMMFAARRGVGATAGERTRMRAAFVASFVLLFLAMNEGVSSDPLVISAGLSPSVVRVAGGGAGVVFVGAGVMTLVAWARRTSWAVVAPAMTLWATQALWFVVPIAVSWVTDARAPQTRYSSGILAVMHSLQYLWITQYFARRDAGAGWHGRRYWLAVILGGLALFLPVPWVASYVAHTDFTLSVLIVTAIVNLHHFMIDGVVWKLRDPRVGRALAGDAASAAGAQPRALRAPAWRRPVLAAVGGALIVLAAVDQWRYHLAGRESDPEALRRAMRLNPFDSAAEARLVRALQERDDIDGLGVHFAEMVQRRPRDPDARVNAGVVARQAGRLDEAIAQWRAALALQPEALHVRAYLAEVLDAQDRLDEALAEYRTYADAAVGNPRLDPPTVLALLLKYGDAATRAGRLEEARAVFTRTQVASREVGLPELATEAEKRLAALPR